MNKKDWVWMPHAGHFILGHLCRFRLTTYVGGYVVSTVGEYLPGAQERELLAESKGIKLKGKGDERVADYIKKIGFEEISCDGKYETMVFKAERSENKCCPFVASDWCGVDMERYNEPGEACKGHLKMCEKWSRKGKGRKGVKR